MTRFQLPTDRAEYLDLVLPAAGGLLASWRTQSSRHTAGRWTKPGGKPGWTVVGEYVGLSADAGWVSVFDRAAQEVRVVPAGGKKPVATVPCRYDNGYVGSAVAPGGGELTLVYGDELIVYALPAGTETARKRRAGSFSPRYSPAGRWLFTPGDRAVRLFDRTRRMRLTRLLSTRFPKADVSDAGRAAAAGPDDQTVTVWDLSDNSAAAALKIGGYVTCVALTPDARRLLTTTTDGEVTLWDAAGRKIRQYAWGISLPIALAVAPDGLTAAVGGNNGHVVVWDLDD